jgi:hypothetical protein
MRKDSNGATYTPSAAWSGSFSAAVDKLVMVKHPY